MNVLLAWTRHLLVLLPSVATALLYDIPSYAEYVAWLLAGLLLIRLGVVKLALAPWLLPAEIVWFGWYASVYGGLLFFTLYACLIAVYMTIGSTSVSALFAAGSLFVMNSRSPKRTPRWCGRRTWGCLRLPCSFLRPSTTTIISRRRSATARTAIC